ncbi:MAG: heavy metal-binding domain-containing protein [Planctomycetaceae bacterium]
MALERARPVASSKQTVYTCPMHSEVEQSGPGQCPQCGMPLEPKFVGAQAEADPELTSMTRRFKISLLLTLPLFIIAMGPMVGCRRSDGWEPRSSGYRRCSRCP